MGPKGGRKTKRATIYSKSGVPEDAWFVIPVQAFTPRKSLRLYPRGDPRGVTYGQYREAWWLMATGQE